MPLGIDSVVGASIYRTRGTRNMVKPLKCLRVSTVWQARTFAIPEEDNTTSHMHLMFNSIVGAYHHPVPTGVGNKT